MENIIKSVDIILTEKEINSVNDIEIKLNIYSEKDPNNEEGLTYTITYPKSQIED